MALKVITDTSCDLPEEELEKYGIEMVPLKVTFDDGKTYLDRFELNPRLFVEKMRRSKILPKTAAPDPHTLIEYFERGLKEAGEVIFVSISSGLSSTYQAACLAKDMLKTDKIKIFDTLTASLGTGIMAIKACEMGLKGLSLETIVREMEKIRKEREVIFTLDTLENVVKGGRLSRLEGLAADFLHIKPILRGNAKGVPEIVEKVRGRKKAIKRMVEMVEEIAGQVMGSKIVGISHVNCLEEAHQLAEQIKNRFNPRKMIVSDMSATVGTYAGEGGLMINF
ncbi:EDD domain protein, DegV family [Thermosyntropha lipolytica DSM 11003]|uniref:EDD domain protein, DegV family n=1 Tax=Thermosyntropha lipolytica DSM 11003 TaxID=1123382 RepID=A0A1M5MRP4_9FIRM|nr:DegV family protein [Thermosyntropha lipolytica]SHG80044.1 EDD domain protein, DegV family [Thermosyntropha lipolytica DSM 11003]